MSAEVPHTLRALALCDVPLLGCPQFGQPLCDSPQAQVTQTNDLLFSRTWLPAASMLCLPLVSLPLSIRHSRVVVHGHRSVDGTWLLPIHPTARSFEGEEDGTWRTGVAGL